jgi:hypothetical protein
MWLLAGSAVAVLLLAAAIWRIALDRHRKRQNRSMREHLNRIYSGAE